MLLSRILDSVSLQKSSMSKRRRIIELRDYLNDILEMIADIGEFTKSLTFEEFKNDKKTVQEDLGPLEAAVKEVAKEFSD